MNGLLNTWRVGRIGWGSVFVGFFQIVNAALSWRQQHFEMAGFAVTGTALCLTIGYGSLRGEITVAELERIAPPLSVLWAVVQIALVFHQVSEAGMADQLLTFLDIFSVN